ncbi:hypothetical protein DPX16_8232 [Anabarilius grahami]|uniref:Uncharacterized protein n=1 Tax=Anabarilius grahami TaxID=495550 RepID=A0A3N0Y805_ANAGA|nr:hypothetical protein DPX16_8232 [Anabarilius grahami]
MELWGDGDAREAEHPPDGEVSPRTGSGSERASAGLFPETPDAADWMSGLKRDADAAYSSRMPPSARITTSGLGGGGAE